MTEHKPPSSYLLKDFFDVTVPEPVSWFPQTIGWQVLLLLFFAFIGYLAYQKFVFWRANKYRRNAIAAISQLTVSDKQLGSELFSIMKKSLVHLNSLHGPLFGQQFLACLDSYFPANQSASTFNNSLGEQWLQSLLVSSLPSSSEQNQQLMDLCLDWLNHHQSGEQR